MTLPEDAPAEARARAERKRAAGESLEGVGADPALERSIAPERPTLELIEQWSVLEVDADVLYSTRRGGGPITAVKRLLMRLMRQYFYELETRQTRFNVALAARFRELEQRVERLERSAGADGEPGPRSGDGRDDAPGAPRE